MKLKKNSLRNVPPFPARKPIGRTSRTRTSNRSRIPESLRRPPLSAWLKSRKVQASLAAVAVVLLSAMWMLFRPAQHPAFAEQMGALPGLNGGLNGDWWFAEMPWYGPGIRKAMMQAIRDGETQIDGVSLTDWQTRIAEANTQSLQNDLQTVVKALKTRLPDREYNIAARILELDPSMDGYDEELLRILPEEFSSGTKLDHDLLAEASATELHAYANILHWVSTSNSRLMVNIPVDARTLYQAAIEAYDENDEVEKVLLAVARFDYSRFLADHLDYSGSAGFGEAGGGVRSRSHAVPNQPALPTRGSIPQMERRFSNRPRPIERPARIGPSLGG